MSVTFFKLKPHKIDPKKGYWDNQDIADFYRAVDILKQAGLSTEVDSGVTDEGDPWFVFMKPETGEVIAHFAQIDGSFIAVSSLNQEVYKGKDIRSIVDQMLERHPMLLPQSKNSGRLMLHPTAALSAFLAAAFILTIDGVKASNLTDVIVGVTSDGEALNVANEAQSIPVAHRDEAQKGMFSELNLANYNVAVLGAALIARELSHNETELKLHSGEDDASMLLNDEGKGTAEGSVLNLSIDLAHDRHSGENSQLAYSIKSESPNLSHQEGDHGQSEDKFDAGENNQGIVNKMGVKEDPGENVTLFSGDYEMIWVNGASVLKINYQPLQQVTVNNGNEQFDTTRELQIAEVDDSSGSSLAVVLENPQEPFQIISSSFPSEEILRSDGVGMTFNSSGELRLVSVDSVGERDLKRSLDREEFSPAEQLKLADSNDVPNEHASVSDSLSENNGDSNAQPEHIVYSKPILGHSLNDIDDTLLLTDAIDVVFYEGGDAEISGFELGTDLLWFFLSVEELKTGDKSVNSQGDLVLDFGDTGTLTFLGMVSDTFIDGIA